MKKGIILLVVLFLSVCTFAQTTNKDALIGTWLTGSGKGKVQIYKEGDKYNGKIVWLKEPTYPDGKPKVDKNNPDEAQKTKPLLGLNMLKGFIFDEDKWVDGTIYDPENGKTYSCKITWNNGKLDVRGYIGISLIGRTDTWFKVLDIK
ncbi:MAG TPA: DUF2147 domain-containing protein [Bacteroidia bacterium]|nr:DUF2147 domain-containing protein [Bacteroidia bacterium]